MNTVGKLLGAFEFSTATSVRAARKWEARCVVCLPHTLSGKTMSGFYLFRRGRHRGGLSEEDRARELLEWRFVGVDTILARCRVVFMIFLKDNLIMICGRMLPSTSVVTQKSMLLPPVDGRTGEHMGQPLH